MLENIYKTIILKRNTLFLLSGIVLTVPSPTLFLQFLHAILSALD